MDKQIIIENDYNFQDIKNLPLDKRIDKVIDILELIQNGGFGLGTSSHRYYNEMHELIGDNSEPRFFFLHEDGRKIRCNYKGDPLGCEHA